MGRVYSVPSSRQAFARQAGNNAQAGSFKDAQTFLGLCPDAAKRPAQRLDPQVRTLARKGVGPVAVSWLMM